jgi:hypothetical protein
MLAEILSFFVSKIIGMETGIYGPIILRHPSRPLLTLIVSRASLFPTFGLWPRFPPVSYDERGAFEGAAPTLPA